MNLSIIIPVHNDKRIERCVKSIDEDVEIVIVMNNPTGEIHNLVNRLNVNSIEIKKQNLSTCYNVGMDNSSNELVLFMDSDCIFAKGTIKKLYKKKIENTKHIIRGYIKFSENSFKTKITKRARTVTTSDVPFAFIPALLIHKSIFDEINDGYRFAEDVVWCGDYEFELRRQKVNIPLIQIKDAIVYHDPISIRSDIRSGFYYGTGKRLRHERTGEKVNLWELIKHPIIPGFKKGGILIGLYICFWELILIIGYAYQKYFRIQERLGNISEQ